MHDLPAFAQVEFDGAESGGRFSEFPRPLCSVLAAVSRV
jgi:hypothetical protein